MKNLQEQIESVIAPGICDAAVADYWRARLEKGSLTRDEGNPSHFCCYFLPYDPEKKKVFIIHHKKSGLWLTPGGHIDRSESLIEAVNREIEEELGAPGKIEEGTQPFLLTTTPITNPAQPCKEHLDVWYRFATDGSEFVVDLKEFLETRWLTIKEARKLITDRPNLLALDKIEKLFSNS